MKKRLLAMALCLALVVGLLPCALADSAPTSAGSGLVQMIAECEGFCSTVMWSGGYAYIGYGCQCNAADYPNGITQAQAWALLEKKVQEVADEVAERAADYGVVFSQNQFDALVGFTYNFGIGWMYSGTELQRLIFEEGLTCSAQELAQCWGSWCHVGTTVYPGLANRRARELQIFLFNDYSASLTSVTWTASDAFESGVAFVVNTADSWVSVRAMAAEETESPSETQASTASVLPEEAEAAPAVVSLVFPEEADTDFLDVSPEDWYYDCVCELSSLGLLAGYEDGTFRPNDSITCGEMLKLVLSAAGYTEDTVPEGSYWAAGWLSTAIREGILEEGDVLSLANPITRRFMAKLAAHALGLTDSEETPFVDTEDPHAAALFEAGICRGSLNEAGERVFCPTELLTRAEAAAILLRLYSCCG